MGAVDHLFAFIMAVFMPPLTTPTHRLLLCCPADVAADPGKVLWNSTCQWVKNISSERLCPTYMDQVCGLDFSSVPAMLRTYDEKVDTSPPRPSVAMIVGIVVGVVGGLIVLGGLLAYCIISKRRHAERVAAAAEAKAAARRKAGNASAVPITATSRVNGAKDTMNGDLNGHNGTMNGNDMA